MEEIAHLLNITLLFMVQLHSCEYAWIRGNKVDYIGLNSSEILEFYNKEKVICLSSTLIPELK